MCHEELSIGVDVAVTTVSYAFLVATLMVKVAVWVHLVAKVIGV